MDDVDPTRIDIEIDPTARRMKGIAYHGHTPFDVPIISHIQGNLWQGGCETGLVLPENIKRVLSLYRWEKYIVNHELERFVEIEMYDSTEQGFDQVESLANMVAVWMYEAPTLVHCQAGLNRSSLVATRALMIYNDWDADTAIKTIRESRSPACLCNPSFEEHLRSLDK